MNNDFFTTFLSVLFAFIVKDFYDVFIQSKVKHMMNRSKEIADVVQPEKYTKKIRIRSRDERKQIRKESNLQSLFNESVKETEKDLIK